MAPIFESVSNFAIVDCYGLRSLLEYPVFRHLDLRAGEGAEAKKEAHPKRSKYSQR